MQHDGARRRIVSQGTASKVFEQTFKNIDNVLRTEAGCQNELDCGEQISSVA
jgi:hypothetical protein